MRLEDGTWEYANYKTEATSITNKCTKFVLEDEIYECLEVDRNAYHIKMKFLYGRALQAVEPVEIKRDKDVRTFISEVKHAPIRPILYVELIPISLQLNQSSHVCPTIPPTCDALYDTQVPKTQDN